MPPDVLTEQTQTAEWRKLFGENDLHCCLRNFLFLKKKTNPHCDAGNYSVGESLQTLSISDCQNGQYISIFLIFQLNYWSYKLKLKVEVKYYIVKYSIVFLTKITVPKFKFGLIFLGLSRVGDDRFSILSSIRRLQDGTLDHLWHGPSTNFGVIEMRTRQYCSLPLGPQDWGGPPEILSPPPVAKGFRANNRFMGSRQIETISICFIYICLSCLLQAEVGGKKLDKLGRLFSAIYNHCRYFRLKTSLFFFWNYS